MPLLTSSGSGTLSVTRYSEKELVNSDGIKPLKIHHQPSSYIYSSNAMLLFLLARHVLPWISHESTLDSIHINN
jgi:hypothetical protein